MRNYLGIVSILILFIIYLILDSLVGKQIGQLWALIIVIGYAASVIINSVNKGVACIAAPLFVVT